MPDATFATTRGSSLARWMLPSTLAVAAFALGHALFAGALHPLDDGTYATLARNAAEDGDWLPLRYDGAPFYQHGPLIPWLTALLFRLFGFDEAWARLPSILFGVGTVALAFVAARRSRGEEPGAERDDATLAGLGAAVALLSTEAFLRFAGRARFDAPLGFAALWAIVELGAARARPRRYLAVGVAVALAISIKGAAGLVVLGAAFVALLADGRIRELARPWPWVGVGVALALPAAWIGPLLAMDAAGYGRAYLVGFVGEVLTKGRGMTPVPFGYYFGLLAETYWPWLPAALAGLARAFWPRQPRGSRAYAVASIVWLVALALPQTKYAHYALPLYPLFAVLVGVELSRWLRGPRLRRGVFIGWLALAAVAIGVFTFAPLRIHASPLGEAFRALGPELARRVPKGERVPYAPGLAHWEVVAGLELYARRWTRPLEVAPEAHLRVPGTVLLAPAALADEPRLRPFAAPPCGKAGPLALLCAPR